MSGECGCVCTARSDRGATSAGPRAVDDSSRTTPSSASRQYVQFQPACASAGDWTAVMWPPKNARPRAPLAIAWYAMKRRSAFDGNRGTRRGFDFVGVTPLQAIWSVTQTGLVPAACRIHCVTSPTTLMSLFALSECTPGGYETG